MKALRIVGIGGAAGGLEAAIEFFRALPTNPGLAFVVVLHPDSAHENALAALLSRAAPLPVMETKNNLRLEANRIYLAPLHKALGIAGTRLKVTRLKAEKQRHRPIDEFLRALAAQQGSKAVGVILSGNGSDGTRGLLAIHAAGGVTLVQDPKLAQCAAMPLEAVTAGGADFVMPPAKLAKKLVRLFNPPASQRTYSLSGQEKGAPGRPFEAIFALLLGRTGVDFKQYRRATLERPIRRRLRLRGLATAGEYLTYLRGHPAEAEALLDDMLMRARGFFHDNRLFVRLKKTLLSRLLKDRGPREPIRVWVPGCYSGEEVYSLAIVLREFLTENQRRNPVQIFGTDISLKGLDLARAGSYSGGIARDISPRRLRRHFVKSGGRYLIAQSIRETCVFARHNLAVDPPLANLDLISCRNELLYHSAISQGKILTNFHYALRPGGYLLLGALETTGPCADLFERADTNSKIYCKRTPIAQGRRRVGKRGLKPEDRPVVWHTPQPNRSAIQIEKQTDRLVLTQYSPNGVVVDRHLRVLQFRGRTSDYLQHRPGKASLNLLKIAREGLGPKLRATINQAVRQNIRIQEKNIRLRIDGTPTYINLEVMPFGVAPSERLFFIRFERAGKDNTSTRPKRTNPVITGKPPPGEPSNELAKVRQELSFARASYEAILENQEAINEEITSSNEQLQNANEELETAKEELQSTNEELTTLNDELENRNAALNTVNHELHGLMGSINVPMVIVGPALRIRRFTSAAQEVLKLAPEDVGRPLTDVPMRLEVPRLEQLIAEVTNTLQPRELELQDQDHQWWSVRIHPYKASDQKVDGAVLAFVNLGLRTIPPTRSNE